MKILLIEDDEVDIIAVRRLFKRNYISNRLEISQDPAKTLNQLQERYHQPSAIFPESLLILLDLYLPKMDGREFLIKLRSDSNLKQIPVVVLLTFEQERFLIEAENLNVSGYLKKPFTFSELTQLMLTLNQKKMFNWISELPARSFSNYYS
ncbi:response regulator [Chroococcus sp. FPU101]|uniref:response regulator n=1 Tax=Chroococcus sp. FPU101 TaxID=1974212 RepID=UPI001AA5EC13|nr:response regulator [Chroococcus sp. FPU101]GFE72233.1 response regulator receiver protein [Chroococcus sp. FPU101]